MKGQKSARAEAESPLPKKRMILSQKFTALLTSPKMLPN